MSGMGKFTTGFARTKQQIFQKTGHSDETIDVEYSHQKEKIVSTEERMQKIQKNHKKIIDLYKDLSTVMSDISADCCDLYDTRDAPYTPAIRLKDLSEKVSGNNQSYLDITSNTFSQPLSDHLIQYKEIKKRNDELATRKVDMDRYKKEMGALREKAVGSSAKAKLGPTEEKYNICRDGYEALHEELLKDMPLLYEDKYPLFQYLMAALVKSQEEFYSSTSREWSVFPPMVSNINDQLGASHKPVITSVEKSSSSVNIREDPVFKGNSSVKAKQTSINNNNEFSSNKNSSSNNTNTNTGGVSLSKPTAPQPYNPQPVKRARAVYDFNGLDASELTFKNGDIITIFKAEGEWWEGEINGKRGFIPANYVEMI